ncbi:respiratory nitrate reductase subunit gamma [Streptomyces sp. NPDC059785]|uniref:respiratory nitrate reductase subunit gamma n=1 Tax=Streptomyces sp. NPDC059785 TaxID=3346945 RepID=UPI00365E4827
MPYFTDYVKRFTDLPFPVALDERGSGTHVPGQFVNARDLDLAREADAAARRWMPVLYDTVTERPAVPNGTPGRPLGQGERGPLEPRPRRPRPAADAVRPARHDDGRGAAAPLRRGRRPGHGNSAARGTRPPTRRPPGHHRLRSDAGPSTGSGATASYDYRLGVSVWFRSLLTLDPNVPAMAGAPLAYRVHALLGMALFTLWPFSRLVHAFTAPLGYPTRPYIVHRSRGTRRVPGAQGAGR